METPIDTWEVFWQRESDELCEILPLALVGGSAITTACFQPPGAGRLVYLTRDKDGKSQCIPMDSGPNSDRIFKLANDLPYIHPFPMDPDMTEAYQHVDKQKLLSLYEEEIRRYDPAFFHADTYLLREGIQYSLQVAFPSPLHHESKEWWGRLPRLGLCYTLENKLAHKDGLSSEGQKSTSELVLILSAVHAANRIMSKRLALLFENIYCWTGFTKEEMSVERIARSLCIEDLAISSDVKQDQHLYLITKLLLAHHLFFPHSPAALNAFKCLGKDPNADILIPHGWEAVNHFESNPTDIGKYIDQLIKDIALLVRAFTRWERPESVTRRADADLVKDLRRLIVMALGILCGTFVWKEHDEYLALVPPKALIPFGPITLPAITKGQVNYIRQHRVTESNSFYPSMQQLSPLAVVVPETGYKIKLHVVVHKRTGTETPKKSEKMQWLSKYLRDRIELQIRDEDNEES